MLTELQAWDTIAKMWWSKNLRKKLVNNTCTNDGNMGLCGCINDLYIIKNSISYEDKESMLDKIREFAPKASYGYRGLYCWSNTPLGARSRIKFCRKMIKMIKSNTKV